MKSDLPAPLLSVPLRRRLISLCALALIVACVVAGCTEAAAPRALTAIPSEGRSAGAASFPLGGASADPEDVIPCPAAAVDQADVGAGRDYLRAADRFNAGWNALLLSRPFLPDADREAARGQLDDLAALLRQAISDLEALRLSQTADPARVRLVGELRGVIRVIQGVESAPSDGQLGLLFVVPVTVARRDGSGPRGAAGCLRSRMSLPPPADAEVL